MIDHIALIIVGLPVILFIGVLLDYVFDNAIGSFLKRAHKPRLIVMSVGAVVVGTFLLHTFNDDFRTEFNRAFFRWWRTVPMTNVVVLALLLLGFLFWAYKVVMEP